VLLIASFFPGAFLFGAFLFYGPRQQTLRHLKARFFEFG
jgi:hypothetical protein